MSGRPRPEVIVNFSDGMSYSKTKLDELYSSGFFNPKSSHRKKEVIPPQKKEHVEFLVKEFEVPKQVAEKSLAQNDGDLRKAIDTLIDR